MNILKLRAERLLEEIRKDKLMWCAYDGTLRLVLPAVCRWHKNMKDDPKCAGCDCNPNWVPWWKK